MHAEEGTIGDGVIDIGVYCSGVVAGVGRIGRVVGWLCRERVGGV